MKLVTKISAAAILMLLLFSQIFSGWILCEMREEVIGNIENYEGEKIIRSADTMRRKIKPRQFRDEQEKMYMGKEIFRKYFETDSVLYYKGKEIANSTPYEFDLKKMEQKNKTYRSAVHGLEGTEKSFLEEIEGRKLLIFHRAEEDFQVVHYKDVTSVYKNIQQLFVKGIFAALALSGILLALLQWIIRRILEPLEHLKEAANSIAGGNYTERISVQKKDEIGKISISFNQMAERIQEHICELGQVNEKQRQLLGSLAHELKTPMTAIQGYAETLQRIQLPPEKQERSLAYIEKECKRLSRLSAKMLELTELSGEGVQIERKEIPVLQLLEQVRELTQYRTGEKGIHMEIRAAENLMIRGDEDLLISFLTNLVDNACKASEEGGIIRLTGTEQGIFVQDEGRGIPEEEQKNIAEPFYMVDKSRARKEGGAGLGLALCSQIARLHGGILDIQSQVGVGTVIGLRYGDTVTNCLQPGADLDTGKPILLVQ